MNPNIKSLTAEIEALTAQIDALDIKERLAHIRVQGLRLGQSMPDAVENLADAYEWLRVAQQIAGSRVTTPAPWEDAALEVLNKVIPELVQAQADLKRQRFEAKKQLRKITDAEDIKQMPKRIKEQEQRVTDAQAAHAAAKQNLARLKSEVLALQTKVNESQATANDIDQRLFESILTGEHIDQTALAEATNQLALATKTLQLTQRAVQEATTGERKAADAIFDARAELSRLHMVSKRHATTQAVNELLAKLKTDGITIDDLHLAIDDIKRNYHPETDPA